jgi:hypothetical protein
MQRKQQVGECWVCVIFFACVCVGASDSTTASDDPFSSGLCVVCIGHFLGGSQGGHMPPPPLVTCSVYQNYFFWCFCYFSVFCYF